jgi:hypothetical protein
MMRHYSLCNIDGTSHRSLNTNFIQCGGVLRDHRGFWIKGFARNIGTTFAFKAEQ